MKRSDINKIIRAAQACFADHGWALPPLPRWDVTDFGLGDHRRHGLVLVNLAEEPEYCEKLMYAEKGMTTPAHAHKKKKEDIISRWGELHVQVWADEPEKSAGRKFRLNVNNAWREAMSSDVIVLKAGERVRLTPGIYHEFYPASAACIIGEVSTANDDLHDNFFVNPDIGRYPGIEEDEAPLVKLVSESAAS